MKTNAIRLFKGRKVIAQAISIEDTFYYRSNKINKTVLQLDPNGTKYNELRKCSSMKPNNYTLNICFTKGLKKPIKINRKIYGTITFLPTLSYKKFGLSNDKIKIRHFTKGSK